MPTLKDLAFCCAHPFAVAKAVGLETQVGFDYYEVIVGAAEAESTGEPLQELTPEEIAVLNKPFITLVRQLANGKL